VKHDNRHGKENLKVLFTLGGLYVKPWRGFSRPEKVAFKDIGDGETKTTTSRVERACDFSGMK